MCHPGMMCGMSMGNSGGNTAFLLIALALGFWVLTLADNNANPLKVIGQVVGWLIMLVALGGIVCGSLHRMCAQKMMRGAGAGMGGCPMMSHGCEKDGDSDDKSEATEKDSKTKKS